MRAAISPASDAASQAASKSMGNNQGVKAAQAAAASLPASRLRSETPPAVLRTGSQRFLVGIQGGGEAHEPVLQTASATVTGFGKSPSE